MKKNDGSNLVNYRLDNEKFGATVIHTEKLAAARYNRTTSVISFSKPLLQRIWWIKAITFWISRCNDRFYGLTAAMSDLDVLLSLTENGKFSNKYNHLLFSSKRIYSKTRQHMIGSGCSAEKKNFKKNLSSFVCSVVCLGPALECDGYVICYFKM